MSVSSRTRIRRVEAGTHHAETAWGLPCSRHCWVVQWQTLSMPGPSFWYYGTRRAAREAAQSLRREV